jgi:hypothetical protein
VASSTLETPSELKFRLERAVLVMRRLKLARLDPFELIGYEPECHPRIAAAKAAGFATPTEAVKAGFAESLPAPCGRCAQEQFHAATEFDVGFGGRAGGGKTLTLLTSGIWWCAKVPGFRAVGFRRTYGEIMESFGKELEAVDYARALGAEWTVGPPPRLRFPNRSRFDFRYAETATDVGRVIGGAMQMAMIDERQLVTPEVVDPIRSRIRSERGVPVVGLRSTFNPGDIGHAALKDRYVDGTNMGRRVYDEVVDDRPTGVQVRFIPAPPTSYLPESYWTQTLAGISDPWLRRALQEGDWDAPPGTAFPDWRREIHVVDPEQMPVPLGSSVPRGLGIDYGVTNPFVALWGAVMNDGAVVVYREVTATNLTPTQQAEAIRAAEAPGERMAGRPIPGYLDPSTFTPYPDSPRNGAMAPARSIASDYVAGGVSVTRAYNDRLATKRLVHDALRVHHVGHDPKDGSDCHPACGPKLFIYSTCEYLVKTLPYLPRDTHNPEDVRKCDTDHAYDALRYLLAGLKGRTAGGRRGAAGAGRTTTGSLSRAGF